MTTKNFASPEAPAPTGLEPRHGGQFVDRMFSGFGHISEFRPVLAQRPSEEPYRPLPQAKARTGATYRLQSQTSQLRVQANSPATDVMTDLSRVVAVTIAASASIDEAHQAMITHRVRALFVVDDARVVLGIITANDVLGEKPIQIARNRGERHGRITVPRWQRRLPTDPAFSRIRARVCGRAVVAHACESADRKSVRASRARQCRLGWESVADLDRGSVRQLHVRRDPAPIAAEDVPEQHARVDGNQAAAGERSGDGEGAQADPSSRSLVGMTERYLSSPSAASCSAWNSCASACVSSNRSPSMIASIL